MPFSATQAAVRCLWVAPASWPSAAVGPSANTGSSSGRQSAVDAPKPDASSQLWIVSQGRKAAHGDPRSRRRSTLRCRGPVGLDYRAGSTCCLSSCRSATHVVVAGNSCPRCLKQTAIGATTRGAKPSGFAPGKQRIRQYDRRVADRCVRRRLRSDRGRHAWQFSPGHVSVNTREGGCSGSSHRPTFPASLAVAIQSRSGVSLVAAGTATKPCTAPPGTSA
jgi:hypothetical protein